MLRLQLNVLQTLRRRWDWIGLRVRRV